MSVRIGVDTGGTFTDVVLYDDETNEIHTTKTPSTPPDFDRGVLNGIDKILEQTDTDPGDVSFLSHGTTVGTNAVLEGEIPNLGLITNEGLRDVLEIGDQTRPDLYDLQTDKPPELIPRYLRREVPGRVDSHGEVVDELDEDAVRTVVDELAEEDIESIVVSTLFSYLNPDHEERIGGIIEAHEADLQYALSSRVHPEIREYERTITTVLNEAIKTTVEDYFGRLTEGIEQRGIDVPLNIIHSGGGIFTAEQATQRAVRTITSGPAAGAVATEKVSAQEGFENAIGMDMGGTSADVSLIRDGEIVRSTEGEINDLPIKTPMIDINTVGAGGGSIAWIDEGGILHVGPKSAGADPGPICYGQGGEQPTITDANLLLGRLNPANFLEGEMELIVEETRDRFAETIAEPLDQSVEEAALSVVEVANASIARRVHNVTVERGDDPSDFALIGFGGAGPLQTPAVARRMDMEDVIIPRSPGVFSARGILIADVRVDESHSYRERRIDPAIIDDQVGTLAAETHDRFIQQGFTDEEIRIDRAIDMRYAGQSYELTVPVEDDPITSETIAAATDRFHEMHARLYGHAMEGEDVEVVTLRVTGHVPTAPLTDVPETTAAEALRDVRDVYFADHGWLETDVYDRNSLATGRTVDGPAILEESGATAIVPPETEATVTEAGNVHITL
ncbi:hydantoinase/oxoprolinase family protein [Halopenitus persicus]|uniref:N-methylhydantoinase A n=1 Tax=Halopenitus persicus TaxID=1048396 RepID=A0A1H3L444_9EURY|nr:hydantoinase/oxoprolinase family protein [Halopenitus persicus]QHS18091.1 hydantoinase/oxoprolinase family protein [haloarchaeon 3A1-DGR]SDY58728.1 N-methylhydantoinase A [Halopenitus persicus]